MLMISGCANGSPPVSVILSTRARMRRGSTLAVMSSQLMCSPQLPEDTKQCAQWRLHRSVTWIRAFLPWPRTDVRK